MYTKKKTRINVFVVKENVQIHSLLELMTKLFIRVQKLKLLT